MSVRICVSIPYIRTLILHKASVFVKVFLAVLLIFSARAQCILGSWLKRAWSRPLIQQSCFRLLKLLDFRARFCYDRIRWVLRRRRPIYTTYDTVKRQRFTIGGENVVFVVILSGHDHHRFHHVSHRRLGRAGAGAGKADKPLYDGAGKAQRHDRQPDPRVSDHQGQPRRAGVPANAGAG